MFQDATQIAGSDSYISNETSWWLLNYCNLPEISLKTLQLTENNPDRENLSYATMVDAFVALSRWEEALSASNRSIKYWKSELENGKNENRKQIERELLEAKSRKASVLIHQGKWKDAESILEENLEEFPNTNEKQTNYLKCEILHVKAGQDLEKNDYQSALMKINQCLQLYSRNEELSNPKHPRWLQLLHAKDLLERKNRMRNDTFISSLKVLAMNVSSIDIDQELLGKKIKEKDQMDPSIVTRYKSGQQWYKLYLEVQSGGNLTLEFKNFEIGTARKLISVPLGNSNSILEIDPESIVPSIANLLSDHKNFDAFLFYWNGKSSRLNEGTGVAYSYWPLKLAGFDFGQPRGYSIMATNPEMYGVFDGLLHHEFGHLLESLSNITFVHCQDLSLRDKSKPVYTTWNKSCDTIYDWALEIAFKPLYPEMNWSTRYPVK